MMAGLTSMQKDQYYQDGYTILRNVFTPGECGAVIQHMMDLAGGQKTVDGFAARQPGDWNRTHNQHLYDPVARDILLHPRLRKPLQDCFEDEVDAVQTMYFFKGSEQRRHQDQYYLPGCMSAWVALEDVSPRNGTIYVQPGSHTGKLITREDLETRPGKPTPLFGSHYDEAVDRLSESHGMPEVPVEVSPGDGVLFHGVLIHRGGPILEPGSFRHVMANHYIPRHFDGWPYADWPRISFDGDWQGVGPA